MYAFLACSLWAIAGVCFAFLAFSLLVVLVPFLTVGLQKKHQTPSCDYCGEDTYMLACRHCGMRFCERCTHTGLKCQCQGQRPTHECSMCGHLPDEDEEQTRNCRGCGGRLCYMCGMNHLRTENCPPQRPFPVELM